MKKNLIVMTACMICMACSTTRNIQNRPSDYITGTNNLSEMELTALTQVKAYADDYVAEDGRISGNKYKISKTKEKDWQAFDLYKIDIDKFFEDPKPERIETSIYKPTDMVMLTSKDANSVTFFARKYGDRWNLRESFAGSNMKFAWIKDVISDTKNKSYKVLDFAGRQIFVFEINDKYAFYYPDGRSMDYEGLYRLMKVIYDHSKKPNKDPMDILVL